MSILTIDLFSFLASVPTDIPKQLRVRRVLDNMGGVQRAALRRKIPFDAPPELPTEKYPSALLSYFPKPNNYACLGIVAEKLLLLEKAEDINTDSLALAVQETFSKFGLIQPVTGFDKVLKSKTTQPFLNTLKTTRYTMDVHIKGKLVSETVLNGKNVMGHPDARTPDQLFEIKLTGEYVKHWPYFLCQLFAYGALDLSVNDLYLVLPLQKAVIHFDIRTWASRKEYLSRLEAAAEKLLTPAPPPTLESILARNAGAELLTKFAIGSHMAKLPSLADTVRSLPPHVPSQIFIGPPAASRLSVKTDDVTAASEIVRSRGLNVYIHAPYILNLAEPPSADDWAVNLLQRNLTIGSSLGAKGVVVHVGKSKTRPTDEAVAIMRATLERVITAATHDCPLLLETPAGQGTELLTNPAEFIEFVKSFDSPCLRACLDTCHVFACGHCPVKYIESMLLTKDLLRLVHYNDSMDICGSCKDRHAFVGTGKIGLSVMENVARLCTSAGIPMVVE